MAVRPAARVVALREPSPDSKVTTGSKFVVLGVEMGRRWYLFAAQKDTIIFGDL